MKKLSRLFHRPFRHPRRWAPRQARRQSVVDSSTFCQTVFGALDVVKGHGTSTPIWLWCTLIPTASISDSIAYQLIRPCREV